MSSEILTGSHFVHGDWACAEGAIAAGCRFYAAYPITPATEIAERMALRLPRIGGNFIQFEDELGAIASVIGASYSGVKAMTATSGPGISLMLENIGLAIMTEAPCVVVNVMRGGPSTGQPTVGSQSDVMQCRWGTHGDVEIIALVPDSVQEMFDLTVEAFNLSEEYRLPVFLLADANIGHMYEKLVIPPKGDIRIVDRKRPTVSREQYQPFEANEGLVPPMANFGDGYRFYATGLTHDAMGYPDMSVEAQDKLVRRLCDKIRNNVDRISRFEEVMVDDCDVLVVAYGITARSAARAVRVAREEGIKAGLLRLISVWPFPERKIEGLASSVKGVVVSEMNYGQIVREVERAVRPTPVSFIPKLGENPPRPDEILSAIRRVEG
jgi:2-oxoglutarate ferredoxin oxidoreductase subunit alpha